MVAARNNSKDVVIRVTGENLTAPVIEGVKKGYRNLAREVEGYARDLTTALNKQWDAQKRAAYESLKAEQVVRRARAKAAVLAEEEITRIHAAGARKRFEMIRMSERLAAHNRNRAGGGYGVSVGNVAKGALGAIGLGAWASGRVMPEIGHDAIGGISQWLDVSGRIARDFGIITDRMRQTAKELQTVMQWELDRGRGINERMLSGARADAGEIYARDEFGGIKPNFIGTIAGIQSRRRDFFYLQRSNMQRREALYRENNPAAREKAYNALVTQQVATLEREEGRSIEPQELANIWRRARAAIESKTAAAVKALNEINRLERETGAGIRGERGLEYFLRIGGRFGMAGRNLAGFFGGTGQTLSSVASPFASVFGNLASFYQRQNDIRMETESPAERLTREWGNIQAQRRLGVNGGISPESFDRLRNQLYFGGIAQLPGRQDAPGLAPTTGRFITRAPEQKQADELSAFRREARENAKRQEKALIDILAEIRGGGDAGGL